MTNFDKKQLFYLILEDPQFSSGGATKKYNFNASQLNFCIFKYFTLSQWSSFRNLPMIIKNQNWEKNDFKSFKRFECKDPRLKWNNLCKMGQKLLITTVNSGYIRKIPDFSIKKTQAQFRLTLWKKNLSFILFLFHDNQVPSLNFFIFF